jgi:predicted dehydrogenase
MSQPDGSRLKTKKTVLRIKRSSVDSKLGSSLPLWRPTLLVEGNSIKVPSYQHNMNSSFFPLTRRAFTKSTMIAGAALASGAWPISGADAEPRRVRVGLIGCGSVSGQYLPQLKKCPYAEVVSVCDRKPERAKRRAEQFGVANSYPSIDAMLNGVPFDFLIDTTDMQEHEGINRRALEAGKHVWSEKPIANTLGAGQELLRLARAKNLRLWGAPITVQSPQFAFMAKRLAEGKLGRVAAAHADYGHEGPDWSAFFYEKLGGSMPDLAVYNLTSLTGLLGPARNVMAMLSIVTAERTVQDKGRAGQRPDQSR